MTPLKTHASTKDSVATLLYGNQSAPQYESRKLEIEVTNHIEGLWLRLDTKRKQREITEAEIEKTLRHVDGWLKHKLSGSGMHSLLLSAETKYPDFIRYMPETLASRYEEIRIARIWSSLFDPETLIRLKAGIDFEKNISGVM